MRLATIIVAVLVSAGATPLAQADREVFDVGNPVYREECGSCHVAYPPQLLPKASWQAIMAGLDKHFGSDASLDAGTAKAIQTYLETNASRRAGRGRPPLRITETAWFKDEHDDVPAATWRSAAVKRPASCGACHTKADQGDYSERTLRVPK
jgi:hypothetical protein